MMATTSSVATPVSSQAGQQMVVEYLVEPVRHGSRADHFISPRSKCLLATSCSQNGIAGRGIKRNCAPFYRMRAWSAMPEPRLFARNQQVYDYNYLDGAPLCRE
jgi:hypothetical protein